MRFLAPALLPLLLAAAGPAPLQAASTIKVVITDGRPDGRVDVSVPLALAETALALAPVQNLERGRLRVSGTDISLQDLRKLWKEVKRSGEADLLKVADGAELVTVSTRKGRVLVRIHESGREQVSVDLPHAVVDALLSGEGDELNVSAAVARLRAMDAGEIVRVSDGADRIVVSLE